MFKIPRIPAYLSSFYITWTGWFPFQQAVHLDLIVLYAERHEKVFFLLFGVGTILEFISGVKSTLINSHRLFATICGEQAVCLV